MEILIEFIGADKKLCDYIHDMDDKGLVDIGSYGGRINPCEKKDIMFELDKKFTNLFIDFLKNIESIERDKKINDILNETKST